MPETPPQLRNSGDSWCARSYTARMRVDEGMLTEKLAAVLPYLNERDRRRVLAVEARALGRGGVSAVARAAGVSRQTIHTGLKELDHPPEAGAGRVRRPGGGRKRLTEGDTPTRLLPGCCPGRRPWDGSGLAREPR
jgi:hypothetical protein